MQTEIIINENFPGVNPISFGSQRCNPGHHYGPAVRTFWLLHYIVSGHGSFQRDGKHLSLGPGDIFVIPPYLSTYYEADTTDPWHYIWVGFTCNIDLPAPFHAPVIRCGGAGRCFEDMLRCRDMEGGKSAFLCSRIWELISRVREFDRQNPDYITKAVSLMDASYDQNICVAGIAQQLGLDRSYFSTLFKQRLGISPRQYLLDLRLEKARELMTAHGQSPAVAAASVGYEDLCHFSRIFKQKYGLSPRTYRQKYAPGCSSPGDES